MKADGLGRLHQVDLKDIWENEAAQFTPWLAKEDNLKLLGDTIGVDLELEAQEKSVGPYRADILCKDTANNVWVLVENQLSRTDHTHLGQILTYAAGLNAVTIAWVAERFTDEHRATLDWLNEITGDEISFFGLEVELWRIGDSAVAPKFNIVAKPNEWTKGKGGGGGGGSKSDLSPVRRLQLEYWSDLRDFLIDQKSFIKPQKPLPQHWTNFAVGRSGFHLVAIANTRDRRIVVYLCLTGPDAKPHFHLLKRQKQDIERELGQNLNWVGLPGKKESRIELARNKTDPNDRGDWPTQHQWMQEHLEAFHRVFSGRIKGLDAEDYEAPQENE